MTLHRMFVLLFLAVVVGGCLFSAPIVYVAASEAPRPEMVNTLLLLSATFLFEAGVFTWAIYAELKWKLLARAAC